MELTLTPWRGSVTLEERDARTGRVIGGTVTHNAYTTAGAHQYASALAGAVGTAVTITHIDLGTGGYMLSNCDSVTGWTTAPALDTTTYREGSGSLKGIASASGSVVYAAGTSVGGTAILNDPSTVDLYLRLTSRSAVDMTGSQLRVYSGSTAVYRYITFTGIETATGLTMSDATWVRQGIPVTAAGWTTGSGSPTWANVSGVGIVVKASGAGTATVHWDQILGLPTMGTAVSNLIPLVATPGSRGLTAVTGLSASAGTVTAQAAWAEREAIGDISYVGLYTNGGSTLVAVAPLTYYKPSTSVLTVTWTVTVAGG